MPPRHAYWTILIDDQPTAFRAHDPEELLPTLNRLREKNGTAVMKWFERGKLFDSRDAAKDEGYGQGERRWEGPRPERRENHDSQDRHSASEGGRDKKWRPGGEHRDPRQKYKDAKKAKWTRFKEKIRERHEDRVARDPERFTPPHGDKIRGPREGADEQAREDRRARDARGPRDDWRARGERGPRDDRWDSGRNTRDEPRPPRRDDRRDEPRPPRGDDRRDEPRAPRRDDRGESRGPRRDDWRAESRGPRRDDWRHEPRGPRRDDRRNDRQSDSRDTRDRNPRAPQHDDRRDAWRGERRDTRRDDRGGRDGERSERRDTRRDEWRNKQGDDRGERRDDWRGARDGRPSRPHGDKFREQRPKQSWGRERAPGEGGHSGGWKPKPPAGFKKKPFGKRAFGARPPRKRRDDE